MKKIIFSLMIFAFVSCTENDRAKNYGGKQTVKLAPGERLVNMTWKDSDMWILTKQDSTKPTEYKFAEKSNLGLWSGEIIVVEQ